MRELGPRRDALRSGLHHGRGLHVGVLRGAAGQRHLAARNVCAPSRAYTCLGPAPAGACTNFDACVTVVDGVRGTHCGDVESIEVRVRNDCTAPVDVELCYERIDGSCACGVHRSLAPGAVGDPVFWACAVTGRYRFSARAAGDVDTCHSHGCN